MTLHTDPPGATVWRKAYGAPDSTWIRLGNTPLDSVLLALSWSGSTFSNTNRLRIEAPGYRTLDLIGMPFPDSVLRLERDSALPPEMVRIAGGDIELQYPGFDHAKPVHLHDYLIDRFEVTNREYKAFVDSGGYRRREIWEHPFVQDGHDLSWDAAMKLMTDRSGRPGPSTWEGGDYPPDTTSIPSPG